MDNLLEKIKTNYWLQCILNSYSLMLFSLDNVFAFIILIVTFFTPIVGLFGFLAIVLINIFAFVIGFNREEIQKGIFGFNALFLGLAMGYEYSFNSTFVVLFITGILSLLLITVWLKGIFAVYNLPFLSFPFIITYWIVSLAAANFSNIHLDESHIYTINELTRNQSSQFFLFIHSFDNLPIFSFALIYFKTLAGTFFQSSVMGGMLLAFGLLYFSRIAFSLSVIGFASAYFFYSLFGADVNDLNYYLQGANYIFLAIAIGCFFIIPNTYSYLTILILTPLLMLVLLSFGKILAVFQLKAYSLSFSVVCTAFLFSLNQRWLHKYLQVVTLQYFSAEKTIYKYLNSIQRFKNEHLLKIALPFSGEWNVSQGYDGKITHLGDWSKALDFVIVDSKSNTYREPANVRDFSREYFYCYNKEIFSPYDGYVYDIINTVEENDVGEVNTDQNWGNTVILNHLNGLFSQISHVKKDSFNVFIGQYITKGTFLATCGNSGRSPEPHIHFQLQTTPTIGAKTIEYPISYFIERKGNERSLRVSEVPKEGTFISNVQVNELLIMGFSFLPGQKISFQKENSSNQIHWEVLTDAWNRTYIYCDESKSYAYFINDGVMLYFTDFEGDKRSLLFSFYLAAYRQLLGYYETIVIEDNVPLIHFNNKAVQFFQDFIAPFYLFTKAKHTSTFSYGDNLYAPQKLIIKTKVEAKLINYIFKKIDFELELKDNKIYRFAVHQKNKS
ncbi:MAG: urea transporter, partial [Bacteroidetes bacterium]|nr:urea transporter [Bacteroidota bacterium]